MPSEATAGSTFFSAFGRGIASSRSIRGRGRRRLVERDLEVELAGQRGEDARGAELPPEQADPEHVSGGGLEHLAGVERAAALEPDGAVGRRSRRG